jgi:succinate dehydrogenase / fumarate reductase flavoprotein subunit
MIDVLVVGAGGAGLTSAIWAKNSGANRVVVVSKSYPTESQTSMAQGGINANLETSKDSFIKDTLNSSKELADIEAINSLVENSNSAIEWLNSIGVPFNRDKNSNIAQRKLGGASENRAVFSSDYSGLKILHSLFDEAIKVGVEFIYEHQLLNFIVEDSRCYGATFLDIRAGEVATILAKSTIIATGGYASLYENFTTNSSSSTGDGVAAALRAGVKLSNMEFIQFHPTSLKSSSILISETARGEGGYLINSKGERFVDELDTRDIVARAIYSELENGEEVFLDLRHLKDRLDKFMPQELKLAKLYEGVDAKESAIPIKPTAHYTMGGVSTNINTATNIEALFACGECADIKVHGANRLGGNSLLELIVFGIIAGKNSSKYSKENSFDEVKSSRVDIDIRFIKSVFKFPNSIDFYEKKEFLGKVFYRNMGLFRKESDLRAVLQVVRQMQKELKFMGLGDKSKEYNQNLVEFIEFGNILELSEVAVVSAINRKESRGAHYRADYPTLNKDYSKPTVAFKDEAVLSVNIL